MWLKYLDIRDTCLKLGVPPTGAKLDGTPYYTLPTIYNPNTDTAVTDALLISQYLDRAYPDTPVLVPKGSASSHAALEGAFLQHVGMPLVALSLHQFALGLFPTDQRCFLTSRALMFGTKLDEMAPSKRWLQARKRERSSGRNWSKGSQRS